MLLPYLPDPLPFPRLLQKLRADIRASLDADRLTMLGEIGLDGQARMRWPLAARHLHPESLPASVESSEHDATSASQAHQTATEGAPAPGSWNDRAEGDPPDEWRRLTPFKTSMEHQRAIVNAQVDIAVELVVNVSFHSVRGTGYVHLTLLIHIRPSTVAYALSLTSQVPHSTSSSPCVSNTDIGLHIVSTSTYTPPADGLRLLAASGETIDQSLRFPVDPRHRSFRYSGRSDPLYRQGKAARRVRFARCPSDHATRMGCLCVDS